MTQELSPSERLRVAAFTIHPEDALITETVDPDEPITVETENGVLVAVNLDGTVTRATVPASADTTVWERAADLAEDVAIEADLRHDIGAANGARDVVAALRAMIPEPEATR